jgi:uncharacterized protein YdhG (YjbR/CyaY superfamily)
LRAKTVEEYLAGVPEPARSTLEKVRAAIRSAAPAGATEVISYGIPTFKAGRALVAFAAFKNHCSFFPMSKAVIASLANELEGYFTSKGTIRFARDKPLPATLIRRMVKARLAENRRRAHQ